MVGTKIRSYAFAVRDEMLSAGEYGGAMVIISDGEVVVHHVKHSKMHSYYYHARVESWNEGALPLLPMPRVQLSNPDTCFFITGLRPRHAIGDCRPEQKGGCGDFLKRCRACVGFRVVFA